MQFNGSHVTNWTITRSFSPSVSKSKTICVIYESYSSGLFAKYSNIHFVTDSETDTKKFICFSERPSQFDFCRSWSELRHSILGGDRKQCKSRFIGFTVDYLLISWCYLVLQSLFFVIHCTRSHLSVTHYWLFRIFLPHPKWIKKNNHLMCVIIEEKIWLPWFRGLIHYFWCWWDRQCDSVSWEQNCDLPAQFVGEKKFLLQWLINCQINDLGENQRH